MLLWSLCYACKDAFFNCSKNGVFFYLLITWRENYIELNGLFGQNIEKILKKRSSIPVIWSSTSEKLWVHELWSKKEPKKAILLGAKKCYMRKRVCFSSTFSFFGLWFCTLIKTTPWGPIMSHYTLSNGSRVQKRANI